MKPIKQIAWRKRLEDRKPSYLDLIRATIGNVSPSVQYAGMANPYMEELKNRPHVGMANPLIGKH